jgi:hypothetical protein
MISKFMKLLGALLLIYAPCINAQDTLRVLFVGNSYTYSNNLPELFTGLAASAGRPVLTAMNAPGGYTLEQHAGNPATIALINQGTWNYIMLQEQSQYPTIPYYRLNSFYPAARALDSLIVINGAQTVFFMTWGRKHGGQQMINGYYSYPFVNFFQMQDTLAAAYTEISQELEALLSPVGNAWAQAVILDSTIDLWQSDGSHPTLQGSYLAACTFYATSFNSNPMGLAYTGGLTLEQAAFLQYAAWTIVLHADIAPPRLSRELSLQVSPNPFNSTATLNYELHVPGFVSLKVYNTAGRLVITPVNGWRDAGAHAVSFDGSNLTSGLYLYTLTIEDQATAGKVLLLK